jgi:hypothetical protein
MGIFEWDGIKDAIRQHRATREGEIGFTGGRDAILGNGAIPNILHVPPAQAQFGGAMWARLVDGQDNIVQLLQVAQHYAGINYDKSSLDYGVKIGYPPNSNILAVIGPADNHVANATYRGILPSQVKDYRNNTMTMNRLADLRVKAAGGLSVKLGTGHYIRDGVIKFYKHDGTLDLTSYVPSTTNFMKWVLVYVDSTDALNVVDGTEYDLGQLVPVNEGCPTALPAGGLSGAAVRLYEGQTDIIEEQDIYPLPHLIEVSSSSAGTVTPGFSQLRLTSITNTPVPIGNNSASATVYYTFYTGWHVNLYNTTSSAWEQVKISGQLSASIAGLTASTFYDVFVDATETLTFAAWTGTSSRATALGDQDGVRVMDSDHSKLYIGKILIDSGGGTCTQSRINQGVSNYYNRAPVEIGVYPPADSWVYNSATIREWGGGAAGAGAVHVTMVTEPYAFVRASMVAATTGPAGNRGAIGFGLNTTTAFSSPLRNLGQVSRTDYLNCHFDSPLGEGLNILYAVERCEGTGGNVTFFGDGSAPALFQMGFTGFVLT